jgi:superoxide dismutase
MTYTAKPLSCDEPIATNSMILHELCFDSLGGDGVSGGAIEEALTRDFGSVDRWRRVRRHREGDYGASAERYVDAFMENIDWAHVARLHQAHAPSEPESELEVWRASR